MLVSGPVLVNHVTIIPPTAALIARAADGQAEEAGDGTTSAVV
jgi:chaperonin GroEL (HSP60 family)